MKSKCYGIFAVTGLIVAVSGAAFGQEISPEAVKAPEWTIPPSKLVNLNHPKKVPNEYIVVFKGDDELAKDVPTPVAKSLSVAPSVLPTTSESITRIGLGLAGRYRSKTLLPPDDDGKDLHRIEHTYSSALRGFSLNGVSEEAITELARDPRVKYVEAVLKAHASAVQSAAPWDLDRIDQAQGLDGLYNYSATGAGVTIWVLDTGVQFSHQEFGGRAGTSEAAFTWCGGPNVCSNYYTVCPPGVTDPNCNYRSLYLETNAGLADGCGHGTAVASAAAGAISGVAKGATIRGVRVTTVANGGPCDFDTATIIAGIDYVLNHRAANGNIINMSIEVAVGDQLAPTFESAVAQAVNAGIVFVTAAGNEAQNACDYDPGRLSYVITVGATTKSDVVLNYTSSMGSNWGTCVTLFAPGEHVTVADNGASSSMDTSGTPPGSNTAINTITGTSFSAPIVAGIAALYLQNNPGASPATVKQAIISAAWVGKLSDPRFGVSGSPNRLASPCVSGNAVCTNNGGGSGGGGGGGGFSYSLYIAALNLILF